jgi:hypothetical protein
MQEEVLQAAWHNVINYIRCQILYDNFNDGTGSTTNVYVASSEMCEYIGVFNNASSTAVAI